LSTIRLRRELIASGLNDKAIARMVKTGQLHRVRYGSYVSGEAWTEGDDADRHALAARSVLARACSDVGISHASALGEWDVPLWDTAVDEVHITRTDQRAGRREAGVVQHLGALREHDVVLLNGVPVTSPTRTALDALGIMDTEHGLTVVNDLLHRGLTTPEDLEACRCFMERWPGSLAHDVVLRLADGRCGESVGEGRTFFICWKHGIPMPQPQYPILDRWGQVVAYLDHAWPERRAFVEFDGRVKYEGLLRPGESVTDAVLREKRREEMICELTGWRCLRLVWGDLYHPERTAHRIQNLLAWTTRLAS
jgi:hypothetical protein